MNTHVNITTAPLVYNGVEIIAKGEMLSLTNMWNAAGADLSKQPAKWRELPSTKEFTGYVSEVILQKSEDEIFAVTRGGKSPGTWAHWQVAMNYARYLEPAFAAWCNQVVRERMEGKAAIRATSLTDYDVSIIGNVVKNCTGVVVKEQLAVLLPTMLDTMVSARLAEQSFLLRRGKTAGQIWRDHGFPRIRVTSWFSNRLCAMGCQIDGGGRGELGLGTAKLFDPDKADNWLRNGGRKLVEEYVAKRQGQGQLRLVGGRQA